MDAHVQTMSFFSLLRRVSVFLSILVSVLVTKTRMRRQVNGQVELANAGYPDRIAWITVNLPWLIEPGYLRTKQGRWRVYELKGEFNEE